PARRRDRWQGVGGTELRRGAFRAGTRRPRATPVAARLLREEREVARAAALHGARPARVLGVARLSQLRRPVARAAVRRRRVNRAPPPSGPAAASTLRPKARSIAWRLATVSDAVRETPRVRTLVLDVPGWPGHRAGQHVDVRLTAEDGDQSQRSYSIASALEDALVVLTVERLEDGEVSPYLTD